MLFNYLYTLISVITPFEEVGNITDNALKFSEASANLGALKVVFGLFMVTFIIMMLFLISSTVAVNKRLTKGHKELLTLTKDIYSYITPYFGRLVEKEIGPNEVQSLVHQLFNANSSLIKYQILRIRLENHLVDKIATTQKITLVVQQLFSDTESAALKFNFQHVPLCFHIDLLEELDKLKSLMTDEVYKPSIEFQISNMEQLVDLYFRGLKSEILKNIQLN